jgi:diacylglycerol kinase family enzyme
MFRLMRPLKEGKHIGKWGIKMVPFQGVEIRPLIDGRPCEVPVVGQPLVINVDGEPILQAPVTVEWHPAQLRVRGAPEVP